MKKILLYPRKEKIHALVDDADYERLKKYHWFAVRRGRAILAYRIVESERGATLRTLHAEVLGPAAPGMVIDHKNRNPLDCQRENLRLCTPQQNAWNRKPQRDRKFSRYKCVGFGCYRRPDGTAKALGKPWFVRAKVDGKLHRRGMFADEKEAYDASVELMEELHGEYACIGPWEGYSDTPALREVLGRKNGPMKSNRGTNGKLKAKG